MLACLKYFGILLLTREHGTQSKPVNFMAYAQCGRHHLLLPEAAGAAAAGAAPESCGPITAPNTFIACRKETLMPE